MAGDLIRVAEGEVGAVSGIRGFKEDKLQVVIDFYGFDDAIRHGGLLFRCFLVRALSVKARTKREPVFKGVFFVMMYDFK